jgi:hypothetical protein
MTATYITGFTVGVKLRVVSIQLMFDVMFLNDLFCIGDEFEQSKDGALRYATVN